MSNTTEYYFDDPATASNAQPDWKDVPIIPTGEFEARLVKAELKADLENGNLAVLTEFEVQVPTEPDTIPHTEWMTTHRKHKAIAPGMMAMVLKKLAALTGIDGNQVRAAMLHNKHHEKFNELLATRVGRVFRLKTVRKDGSQYTNINSLEAI